MPKHTEKHAFETSVDRIRSYVKGEILQKRRKDIEENRKGSIEITQQIVEAKRKATRNAGRVKKREEEKKLMEYQLPELNEKEKNLEVIMRGKLKNYTEYEAYKEEISTYLDKVDIYSSISTKVKEEKNNLKKELKIWEKKVEERKNASSYKNHASYLEIYFYCEQFGYKETAKAYGYTEKRIRQIEKAIDAKRKANEPSEKERIYKEIQESGIKTTADNKNYSYERIRQIKAEFEDPYCEYLDVKDNIDWEIIE